MHHARISDDELRQLSPDELVLRFRRLEGELAAAQARIAELEAETIVQWTLMNRPTERTMDRFD